MIAKYVQQATFMYNGSSRRDVYSNLIFVSVNLITSLESGITMIVSAPKKNQKIDVSFYNLI